MKNLLLSLKSFFSTTSKNDLMQFEINQWKERFAKEDAGL